MSDVLDTELLVNCTLLAVKKFNLRTIINTTNLTHLNRSEVVYLLSGIIENKVGLQNIDDAK